MAGFNQYRCETDNKPLTGVGKCPANVSAPAQLFLDFTKDGLTYEQVTKEEEFRKLVASGDILPLVKVAQFDDNSTENVTAEQPISGDIIFIQEGKDNITVRMIFEPCTHIRLRKLNNTTPKVFEVDRNRNFRGARLGDNVKGYSTSTFTVRRIESDGTDASYTQIALGYSSTVERNDGIGFARVDWDIVGLNGIQPVQFNNIIATDSQIQFDLATACDGSPVTGVTEVDKFNVLDASGAEQTVTTITADPSVDGRYTIGGTNLVTGSIGTKETIEIGEDMYASSGQNDFVVS